MNKPIQATAILLAAAPVLLSAMLLRAENTSVNPRGNSTAAEVLSPELARADAATLRAAAEKANAEHRAPVIVAREADSRVWRRTTYDPVPGIGLVPRHHEYTELATGLHYRDEKGEWQESKAEIELLPDGKGATAQHGRHKVIFPANLHDGAIELFTQEKQWLRSRVLGLSYFDGESGKSVLLAELKETTGELHAPNQVIYADAFTDLKADVRYTYTLAGFEQDIILREQPASPRDYGLNPETTRLQVLTEFFDAPQPKQTVRENKEARDEELDFGGLRMVRGKAFTLGEEKDAAHQIRVNKSWQALEGRDFLVEEVPVTKLARELEALPKSEAAQGGASVPASRSPNSILHRVVQGRTLPAPRLVKKDSDQIFRVATPAAQQPGFVMDYQVVDASYVTNLLFEGNATYLVSDVYCAGPVVVEGGAVLKYAEGSELFVDGTFTCRTGPYHPAVFTSVNDDTVGEVIDGSTGDTSTPTSAMGLYLLDTNTVFYLRFSHLDVCLGTQGASGWGQLDAWHCQFTDCGTALYPNSVVVNLHNVLIARCSLAVSFGSSDPLNAEHLTVDLSNGGDLNDNGPGPMHFTNCILTAPLPSGAVTQNCAVLPDFYFWEVTPYYRTNFTRGHGGKYYLALGSPARNSGTTNFSAALRAELKTKTTFAPIAYTNIAFTTNRVFNVQAPRDTDAPDLGYHYDPIDFVFGGCVSMADLNFNPGTVAAWFPSVDGAENYNWPWGLHVDDTNTVTFAGRADARCAWVRANTVQEADGSYGDSMVGLTGRTQDITTNAAQVNAQFTTFSALGGLWTSHARDDFGRVRLAAQHCEFYGGSVGQYATGLNFTNCLLHRVTVYELGNYFPLLGLVMRNCTVLGGALNVQHWDGPTDWNDWDQPWETSHWTASLRDTTLDGAGVTSDDPGYANAADYDYNAFRTNANLTAVVGAHSLTNVATFNWQRGALGNFYLPTNSSLINAGSVTNAAQVGLYQFTTLTNQTKEANTRVDMGAHFVALNATGNPMDTDGDGIADADEDVNGNGIFDGNELTDWQDYYNGTLPCFELQANYNTVYHISNRLALSLVFRLAHEYVDLANAPFTITLTNGNGWLALGTNTALLTNLTLHTDAVGLATAWLLLPTNTFVTNYVNVTVTSGTNRAQARLQAWVTNTTASSYKLKLPATGTNAPPPPPKTGGITVAWPNYTETCHPPQAKPAQPSGFDTNTALWLEIDDDTSSGAKIQTHNPNANRYYQLESKTNLAEGGQWEWELGDIRTTYSTTGSNFNFFPVPTTGLPWRFFRVHEAKYAFQVRPQVSTATYGLCDSTDGFQDGIFRIEVANDDGIYPDADVTVFYRLSSFATNGVDYTNLTGQVTIGAGTGYVDVYVNPLPHCLTSAPLVTPFVMPITLALIQNSNYVINSDMQAAQVNLQANDTLYTSLYSNLFTHIVTNHLNSPAGIDYDPVNNQLIVAVKEYGQNTNNFIRLFATNYFVTDCVVTNGVTNCPPVTLPPFSYVTNCVSVNGTNHCFISTVSNTYATNWSEVAQVDLRNDELYCTIIQSSGASFKRGDLFFANGAVANLGVIAAGGLGFTNEWSTLQDAGAARFDICQDQTGTFSNDLIVVSFNQGFVWRVNAATNSTLIAQAPYGANTLEGVTVIPKEPARWGDWAGKILTGAEQSAVLYGIDTNSNFGSYTYLGIYPEAMKLIIPNQNLYLVGATTRTQGTADMVLKLSKDIFAKDDGNLLIVQEDYQHGSGTIDPAINVVRWDGTNMVKKYIPALDINFEHGTFAPLNLPTP